MPYLFLVFAIVAFVFISLGALSVWVSVLATALKAELAAALAVPVVIVLYGLWKWLAGRKPS